MFETIDHNVEEISYYRIKHFFDPCGLGQDDEFTFDLIDKPNRQFIIESPSTGIVFIGYLFAFGFRSNPTGMAIEMFDDVYSVDEQYRSRNMWCECEVATYEQLEDFFVKTIEEWKEQGAIDNEIYNAD